MPPASSRTVNWNVTARSSIPTYSWSFSVVVATARRPAVDRTVSDCCWLKRRAGKRRKRKRAVRRSTAHCRLFRAIRHRLPGVDVHLEGDRRVSLVANLDVVRAGVEIQTLEGAVEVVDRS